MNLFCQQVNIIHQHGKLYGNTNYIFSLAGACFPSICHISFGSEEMLFPEKYLEEPKGSSFYLIQMVHQGFLKS